VPGEVTGRAVGGVPGRAGAPGVDPATGGFAAGRAAGTPPGAVGFRGGAGGGASGAIDGGASPASAEGSDGVGTRRLLLAESG